MATSKLPSYTRGKRLASGATAFYWEPPTWAKPPAMKHGRECTLEPAALGTDLAAAVTRATALNAELANWRAGIVNTAAEGTVTWLFAWYREQDRYTSKAHVTRTDYRRQMDRLSAYPMKRGKFGDRAAAKVDASTADDFYKKLRAKHGDRQATYMMQVCRLTWSWALRHTRKTGVTSNPFQAMGLVSTAKHGNRATSRPEYDLYRSTARAMGFQSMATAAALCFELGRRVSDSFGFVDPDGRERGVKWSNYVAGEKITLTQSKTGDPIEIPLTMQIAGETVRLYPELEDELEAMPRQPPDSPNADRVVVEERSGLPYTSDRVSDVHRKICDKAGLPTLMTFTGFRHGGLTEIGESGEADVRPISGHRTLNTTAIYNKASITKARQIAAKRREHIAMLGETEKEDEAG